MNCGQDQREARVCLVIWGKGVGLHANIILLLTHLDSEISLLREYIREEYPMERLVLLGWQTL